MSLKYPLVHVDDVRPENMKQGEGWAISEFRLPISGKNGSSTTLFHSIFRPGSTHAKHLHRNCDEIAVYLKGHGIVGQGNERTEVRPGHCRLMPKGSEHFFYNETKDEEGLVIGFYVGATSVADTGYEFRGHGLAGAGPDRAEVRGGHVHYIPRGVEHFMHNLSRSEPLEVIGIYVGAGSVEETGYVYTGEVSSADLAQRTA